MRKPTRTPTKTKQNRADAITDLLVNGDGVARWRDRAMPCAIGRAGCGIKRAEGDGVTPVGRHGLIAAYFRADRLPPPKVPCPRVALRANDGWCDALGHPQYDQRITRPFTARHEALWRTDTLYDILVVLNWKRGDTPAASGSAIFLHCAADNMRPTAGCVALRVADLSAVLAEMKPGDGVQVAP